MIKKISGLSPFTSEHPAFVGRFIDFNCLAGELRKGGWYAFENLSLGDGLERSFLDNRINTSRFYRCSPDFPDEAWEVSIDGSMDMLIVKDWLNYGTNVMWNEGGGAVLNAYSDWALISESSNLSEMFLTGGVEKSFLESISVFHGQEEYLDADAKVILDLTRRSWRGVE